MTVPQTVPSYKSATATSQYAPVILDTTNEGFVTNGSVTGAVVEGILDEVTTSATTTHVAVITDGACWVRAAGAFSLGDMLAIQGNGLLDTAASGHYCIAVALEAATAAQDLVRARIERVYAP